METEPCPLTPRLLQLLQASVNANDTSDEILASLLHISPSTVNTEFKRIFSLLGVHSRSGVVLLALKQGWIRLHSE